MDQHIVEELNAIKDTIFDKDEFDVTIEPSLIGGALRDRIAEIQNMQSTINNLAAKLAYIFMRSELRVEEAEEVATDLIGHDLEKGKAKGALKKYYISNQDVKLTDDTESTTLLKERYKHLVYSYLMDRAKKKVSEVNSAIDLGRSLLSWDREEASRMS